ncbi:MAG: hypothetical protein M0Z94_14340 [Dehalococcoidales bacterium]|nr:hypothetical protein [Dehalococcoidales bacterium]
MIKVVNRAYDVEETRPFWRRYLMAMGITILASLFIITGFALFCGFA